MSSESKSMFGNFFDSIKSKIHSFISNIKYSDNEGNYFENLNSSLKQKKTIYPSKFKSQKKFTLNNLNDNMSRQYTKYKFVKTNDYNKNNSEDSKYKFVKINENNNSISEGSKYKFLTNINENNNFSLGENFSQDYLGKKTDRINFNDNSTNLKNEIINDFYLIHEYNDNNEFSNEKSLEKIPNNLNLNESNNSIKMNINQNAENIVKIEDYIDIDEKENMKINKKENNNIKNKEIIKINNDEDEKEYNINDSNFTIKVNNSLNNSLNYSRTFNNNKFALAHDSFSYNRKNLKKNKPENNFVLTKESELSFEIEIIKDKEPKKDLNNKNNSNNSNNIFINDKNYNNPFLLDNNSDENENNTGVDKFSKKSNLFSSETSQNENKNKNVNEIKSLFDNNNSENIFLQHKSESESNVIKIDLSKKPKNNNNIKKDDKRKNKSVQKRGLFGNGNSGNNSLFNFKNENNNLIEDNKESIFGNSGLFGASKDNNKNGNLFGNNEPVEKKSLF